MKYLQILFYLVLYNVCSGQYINSRNIQPDSTTRWYVSNSPGNSPTTSRDVIIIHDSTYWRSSIRHFYFDSLIVRNEPNTNKLLWIKSDGELSAFTASYLLPADTAGKWVSLTGVYPNPSFVGSLAYNKITGVPNFLLPADTVGKWVNVNGIYFNPPFVGSLAYSKITGVPSFLLPADTVGKWVSLTGVYPNPSFVGSLAYSKITGVPAFLLPADTVNKWVNVNGIYFNPPFVGSLVYSKITGVPSFLLPADTVGKWVSLTGVYPNPSFVGSLAYSKITGVPAFLLPTDTVNKWVNVNGIYFNPAFVGSLAYSKLTGAPTIPAAQIQSDWTQANTGLLDYIKNKPTLKRIETYTGTTDGSGNYTVTYGTAYPITPDVQPQLQSGTPSQVVRITASSATAFTVNVTNRASVTILGIDVLLATTTPVSGASVGVLVTSR